MKKNLKNQYKIHTKTCKSNLQIQYIIRKENREKIETLKKKFINSLFKNSINKKINHYSSNFIKNKIQMQKILKTTLIYL